MSREEAAMGNREIARIRKTMHLSTMLTRSKSMQAGGSEKSLEELIEKSSLKVTQATLLRASEEFTKVSPSHRQVDMNKWDVVMRRLGVSNAVVRHKVFKAFDTDNNNSVDYQEFIYGLTSLWQGSVAHKYHQMWKQLAQPGKGRAEKRRLKPYDIQRMIEVAGIAQDRTDLMVMVEHVMEALDVDHDLGIVYDEFQLGILRDMKAAQIFDHIMLSPAFQREYKLHPVREQLVRSKSSVV